VTAPATTAPSAYYRIVGLDGAVILEAYVPVEGLKTVADGLLKVCDDSGVAYKIRGKGTNRYIESLGGLAEFKYGPSSGWVYVKNGVYATVGVGNNSATVSQGDVVELYYTLNGGADVKALYE